MNWILFDNQFNYVASNSGVEQVQSGSSKQALVAPLQTISKNGYLYVYVSNESPQDVYFDDVIVKHYTGPLLQDQSYYPFGLQMAGISDIAFNKLTSQYKFNGGVELEDDFGINLYSTFYRQYDPQLGRFNGIDVRAEEMNDISVYNFGANNPVSNNDPFGDKYESVDLNGNKWHGASFLKGTALENYIWAPGDGFGSYDELGDWQGAMHGGGFGGNGPGTLANSIFNLRNNGANITKLSSKNARITITYSYWNDNGHDNGEITNHTNDEWVIINHTWTGSNNHSPYGGLDPSTFRFGKTESRNWQEAGVNNLVISIVFIGKRTMGRKITLKKPVVFGMPIITGKKEYFSPTFAAEVAAAAVDEAFVKTIDIMKKYPELLDISYETSYRRYINEFMEGWGGTAGTTGSGSSKIRYTNAIYKPF